MQKETLKSIIEKYYLNGLTENTKIVVKNKEIVINFTPTEDRSLVGVVSMVNTDLDDAEIGVYNTTQLLKLLKIMDHTVKITFNKEYEIFNKIILEDNKYDLEFYLADINMISKVPKIKEPKYDLNIGIDKEFVKKFTDAKKALGEIRQFLIKTEPSKNQILFTISDGSSYSNKIKFNIPTMPEFPLPSLELPFSANIFNEILIANRDSDSSSLEISKEGLLKIQFEEKTIKSSYFLVRLE